MLKSKMSIDFKLPDTMPSGCFANTTILVANKQT